MKTISGLLQKHGFENHYYQFLRPRAVALGKHDLPRPPTL